MPNTRAKNYPSPRPTSTPKSASKFVSFLSGFRYRNKSVCGSPVTEEKKDCERILEAFDRPSRLINRQVPSFRSSSLSPSFSYSRVLADILKNESTKMTDPKNQQGESQEGDEASGGVPSGKAKYKTVISWIRPFDGSLEKYMRFSNDCGKCFRRICPSEYENLLCYVQKLLDESQFSFLLGAEFCSWRDLKKCLDEHFKIRLNEKTLFRHITSMKQKSGEELFTFYNRLIAKNFEYSEFLKSSSIAKDVVDYRIDQANDYIRDTFIMAVGMNFRPVIINQKPKNIQEVYTSLMTLENSAGEESNDNVEDKLNQVLSLLKIKEDKDKDNDRFANPEIKRVEELPPQQPLRREVNEMNVPMVCQFCGRMGHWAKFCYDYNRIAVNPNGGNYNNYGNFNNHNNSGKNNGRNNFNKNKRWNGNGNSHRNSQFSNGNFANNFCDDQFNGNNFHGQNPNQFNGNNFNSQNPNQFNGNNFNGQNFDQFNRNIGNGYNANPGFNHNVHPIDANNAMSYYNNPNIGVNSSQNYNSNYPVNNVPAIRAVEPYPVVNYAGNNSVEYNHNNTNGM